MGESARQQLLVMMKIVVEVKTAQEERKMDLDS